MATGNRQRIPKIGSQPDWATKFGEGFECRAEYLSNWINEVDAGDQLTIQTVVNF